MYGTNRVLDHQQAVCLTRLEELVNTHFAKEISLLCSIPGIKLFSAYCILAETGNDMTHFQKATHLIGWAGLKPRNDETPGKIRSRKTLHGSKYLRQMLTECAYLLPVQTKRFGTKVQSFVKTHEIAKSACCHST